MEPTSFHQLPRCLCLPSRSIQSPESEPGHQLPGACGSNFPSAVSAAILIRSRPLPTTGVSEAPRGIFRNFQGLLWLSQFWRLCGWHLVGAKHPTVQRAGPPAKNSPAPDVNSAKVRKHHQKSGLLFPDPWNPGEVSFFFFLHADHIVFFVRSVPSWHFPVQVPSTRTSVAPRIPP